METILHKKIRNAKYRLYPIIIGYNLQGYKLQKKYTIPIIGDIWLTLRGRHGTVRHMSTISQDLTQVAKELEDLAEHLQTIKYIEFT